MCAMTPSDSFKETAALLVKLFPEMERVYRTLFHRERADRIISFHTVEEVWTEADLLRVARPLIHPIRINLREAYRAGYNGAAHYAAYTRLFGEKKRYILLEPKTRLWFCEELDFIGDVVLLWAGCFGKSIEESLLKLALLHDVEVKFEEATDEILSRPYGYSPDTVEQIKKL